MRTLLLLSLFSLGQAQLLQWPLIPFLQCGIRYLILGFDIEAYDKFPTFFDENSTLILAQTGKYKGLVGIEEYVKFGNHDFNPFLEFQEIMDEVPSYLGYDRETDQCKFLAKYRVCGKLDPSTTGSDVEYCNTAFVKLYLSFSKRNISRINVFYHAGFLKFYFETIAESAESREIICTTANGACVGITEPIPNCDAELAQLPLSNDGYLDGLSQGCRILHAALAAQRPQIHCAHIAINATSDPDGQFKCQKSDFIPVGDLFTDEELEAANEFTESFGIDPAVGYVLV